MPTIPSSVRKLVQTKQPYADVYHNISSSFTSDAMRSRVFAIKSFLSEDIHTNEKLYIPINLAKTITHCYTDYTVGQWFDVIFGDEELQVSYKDRASKNNIDRLVYDSMVTTSMLGYSVIRVRDKNWENIPVNNYYFNTAGLSLGANRWHIDQHMVMTVQAPTDNESRWTTHIDRYERRGEQWLARYDVYEYSASFEYTSDLLIRRKDEEVLNYLPLFILSNDFTEEANQVGVRMWASDLSDVMELLQDLNDRQTQMSVEFIKNMQSKMSIPESAFRAFQQAKSQNIAIARANGETAQEDNSINFERLVHGNGESPAHYITKDPSMLSLAMQQQDKTIRFIAAVTRLPVSYFGLEEKSGNKHVGTITRERESFLRRVIAKRRVIKPILAQLIAYTIRLQTGAYQLPRIEFPEISFE